MPKSRNIKKLKIKGYEQLNCIILITVTVNSNILSQILYIFLF